MASRTVTQFSQLLGSKVFLANQSLSTSLESEDGDTHDDFVTSSSSSATQNASKSVANQQSNTLLSVSLTSIYTILTQSNPTQPIAAASTVLSSSSKKKQSKDLGHAKQQQHQKESSKIDKSGYYISKSPSVSSSTLVNAPPQFPSLDVVKQALEQYILLVSESSFSDNLQITGVDEKNDSSKNKKKNKIQARSKAVQTQSLNDMQWAIVGYAALSVYSHLVSSFCTETLPLSKDILYWDSILYSSHNTLSTILYLIQTAPKKVLQSIIGTPTYLPSPSGIVLRTNQFGLSTSGPLNPSSWISSASESLSSFSFSSALFSILESTISVVDKWYNSLCDAFEQAQSVARRIFNFSYSLNLQSQSSSDDSSNDSSNSSPSSPSIWSSISVFLILYSPLNYIRREVVSHKTELRRLRMETAKSLGYLVGESFRLLQQQQQQQSQDGTAKGSSSSAIPDSWKLEIQIAVNTLAKVLQVPDDEDNSELFPSSIFSSNTPSVEDSDTSDDEEEDPDYEYEEEDDDDDEYHEDDSMENETEEDDSEQEEESDNEDQETSEQAADFANSPQSSSDKLYNSPNPFARNKLYSHFDEEEYYNRSVGIPVSLKTPASVATKILNIIESDLRYHRSRYDLVTMLHSKPSWLTRHWPSLAFASLISLSTARSIIGSWPEIVEWFKTSVVDTFLAFWKNWIIEPLTQIYNTIRHDEHDADMALITKKSLKADMESLERMVIQFAVDHGELSSNGSSNSDEDLRMVIANRVRQGDISSVLKPYENQIQTPIKSLITGDLIRSLLIQIQKTKVDVDTAVSGIDRLLQSQQLVFGIVAAMPSFAITYWGAISPFAGWLRGTNRRSRAESKQRETFTTILGRVDRVLAALSVEEKRSFDSSSSSLGYNNNNGPEKKLILNGNTSLSAVAPGTNNATTGNSSGSSSSGSSGGSSDATTTPFTIQSQKSIGNKATQLYSDNHYMLLGLLLCETYMLRDQGRRILPSSRLADWEQDVSDLEDISQGSEFQQRVVVRIWNVYSKFLN